MHGFVLGSRPGHRPGRPRRASCEVYSFLRDEARFHAGETQQFLAGGMLINTMVGIRMADEYETRPDAHELLEPRLPDKLDLLLDARRRADRADTPATRARRVTPASCSSTSRAA